MFLPQTIMAISAALLGGRVERRWGEKRVLLAGLAANLGSMALLVGSRFALGARPFAVTLLLVATALMGIGFGLMVPALNKLASALFPRRVDVAVLALNALLGWGPRWRRCSWRCSCTSAPGGGCPSRSGRCWPRFSCGACRCRSTPPARRRRTARGRARFWLFLAFAIGYGVVETLNGNWAILFMRGVLKAPAGLASVALTAFWAAATAGRVLFAAVERWLHARTTFRLLPWVIAVAFVATAFVPSSSPALGVFTFGLAGLGCSALLPLMISLGQADAPPGHLVAAYQFGYGLAAFGIAPLHSGAGLGLRTLFGGASGVALVLAGLTVTLGRRVSRDRLTRTAGPARPSTRLRRVPGDVERWAAWKHTRTDARPPRTRWRRSGPPSPANGH